MCAGKRETAHRLDHNQTSTIHAGNAWNQLQLRCVGSTISARINGRQVTSVQDTTYTNGSAVMGVATAKSNSPVEARFKDLEVDARYATAGTASAAWPL